MVLAIDSDPVALRIHRLNHPHTTHRAMTLGDGSEEDVERLIAQTVPPGSKWHLHMSPPCQAMSCMQSFNKATHPNHRRSITTGMALVNWSFKLLLRLQPPSWSFEQVDCREISGLLSFLKASFPKYVDYASVNCSLYGLCQTRTRMLAGSPFLLNAFLTSPSLKMPPPKLSEVLSPPPNAVWQRASTGKTPLASATVRNTDGTYSNSSIRSDSVRSIHTLSWTCTATNPHAYLTTDFCTIRHFTPAEMMQLQSFPASYKLPCITRKRLLRAAGNAYPPLVARKFMSTSG